MKIRKYFILVVVTFVLVAGLLGAGHLKSNINNPPIAQASSKEATPTCKTAERRAFVEGVFFAQKVIGNIRKEGSLRGLRTGSDRKEILRGLFGVKVVVENVRPTAERYGITQQILQTDTELRLRQHGIRVDTGLQTQEEKDLKLIEQDINDRIAQVWQQANNADSDQDFLQAASAGIRLSELSYPYLLCVSEQLTTLYININTIVLEDSRRAAFSIDVELREMSYLCRNSTIQVANVWQTGSIGVCSLSEFKEYVRESLRDKVDAFINDYLAANPKERSSEESQ